MKDNEYQNTSVIRKKRIQRRQTNARSKSDQSMVCDIIKRIGNVDSLETLTLVKISRGLFNSIRFCNCVKIKSPILAAGDYLIHKCSKLDYHDYEHVSLCKCCQTKIFSYYLALCMEKLADENRLPVFLSNHLSKSRIRDRTFAYERNESSLRFSIWRHYGAWENSINMRTVQEDYSFDFNSLELHEL